MTTEPCELVDLIPVRRFLRQCKRDWSRLKVADSSGVELSGKRLLIGSLAFRRVLLREVLGQDEPHVGIMLPPTVGGILANTSVSLMNRVAVNLNYALSNADLNSCIRQAGIKHVLTSKRVMDKFGFKLDAITTTLTGATLTPPAGVPPQTMSIDLGAVNPNAGENVKFTFTLPDGSTETITLTATASTTPAAGEFTIGADTDATATNLQNALSASLLMRLTMAMRPFERCGVRCSVRCNWLSVSWASVSRISLAVRPE